MKKVGTITTHSALNYGAVLQAYALSNYIDSQGVDCEIMDYQPAYVEKSYRLVNRPKSLNGLLLSMYQILHYSKRKTRRKKFADFRKEYLKTSSCVATNKEELTALVNTYDLAVCGSDQIWSPKLHQFDEAYFLSYPEIKTKRISYAASFGQDNIAEQDLKEIKRRIQNFVCFGCRENSAKKIVDELTHQQATLVLDPVFLLDAEQWRNLKGQAPSNAPYTLAYFLSNPGKSLAMAKKLADKNNEEIYSIGFSPRDPKYKVHCEYDLGPLEFLAAIDDADVVITNSFHATAFSIIFRKNFFTRLSEGNNSRNDRMLTLLTLLGLEDRTFTESTIEQVDFSKPINYEKVNPKLDEMIQVSKDYLRKALEF